jgi:hypothetical protein
MLSSAAPLEKKQILSEPSQKADFQGRGAEPRGAPEKTSRSAVSPVPGDSDPQAVPTAAGRLKQFQQSDRRVVRTHLCPRSLHRRGKKGNEG